MAQTHDDDADLAMVDTLFAELRGDDPEVSDALMARIISDAANHMPRPDAAAPQLGLWGTMLAAIGGWTSLGGLTTACAIGLWFGIAPPETVETWMTGITGDATTISLYPESTLLGLEG